MLRELNLKWMNYHKNRNPAFLLIFLLGILGCHSQKHLSSTEDAADLALKKKYASVLGVEEKQITNLDLYRFVDSWLGVPYKWGGKTKDGIGENHLGRILMKIREEISTTEGDFEFLLREFLCEHKIEFIVDVLKGLNV